MHVGSCNINALIWENCTSVFLTALVKDNKEIWLHKCIPAVLVSLHPDTKSHISLGHVQFTKQSSP